MVIELQDYWIVFITIVCLFNLILSNINMIIVFPGLLSNETKESSDIEWTEAKYKSGWSRVFTTIALCGAFFGLVSEVQLTPNLLSLQQ